MKRGGDGVKGKARGVKKMKGDKIQNVKEIRRKRM